MKIEATTAGQSPADEARFYFKLAVMMAGLIIVGFSVHLTLGRSTFAAPVTVHLHAVVFMGWVGLYLLQNWLVATGRVAVHRRFGWIAVPWMVAMLWLGYATTVGMVQRGVVPFFFLPQHFLIADPMMLLCFAGLTAAALALRRRTDWHRRLHLCAMAILLGPAYGRLIPMPFLTPFAFEMRRSNMRRRRACRQNNPAHGLRRGRGGGI